MHTPNMVDENIRKISELFPNCITETKDENGKVIPAIDFDQLRQELSHEIVEGYEERYRFEWPDKRNAILNANSPTTATLRPCRSDSVDFDHTQNLYIEGDNLEVLKLLRETYLGKVKMIYIDPPYNTGNDFVYEDDFAQSTDEYMAGSGQFDEEQNRMVANTESNGRFHTDWLNMIYPRLKVARDLLTDDGVIFISIDDNEIANLKKICDELFGEKNFVSNLIWQSTAGSNTGTDIVTVTENILVYTRNRSQFQFNGMPANDSSYIYSDEYEKERGKYALDKLDRRRVGSHYSDALNFAIQMPDGTLRFPGGYTEKSLEGWNYLWSKSKVEWGIANGFIEFKKNNGEWNVYNKRYSKIDNEGNTIVRTIPYRNLITSDQCNTAQGTSEIRSLFECRPFDFPKPSSLIAHILATSIRTDYNALVLDFFSGSATTAHAVMRLNAEDGGSRRFIMVQLPEKTDEKSEACKAGYRNICEIGKERIRRAGKKIKEDNKDKPGIDRLDTGFRVLKLDSSNMEDVFYTPDKFDASKLFIDNVKPNRTPEDLLFQVMLMLGIELSATIVERTIGGKKVFSVMNDFLIACFDTDIDESVITDIAKLKPIHFVMRDSSMASDNVADNFEQIFRTYSNGTNRFIL